MQIQIIRGDAYAVRRPLFRFQLKEHGIPINLLGCVVRVTLRPKPTSIEEDPTDAQAAWKGRLLVSSGGASTSYGVAIWGSYTLGQIEVRPTSADTRTFPVGVELIGDVEVTDSNGEKFTYILPDTVIAIDGVTHRLA